MHPDCVGAEVIANEKKVINIVLFLFECKFLIFLNESMS